MLFWKLIKVKYNNYFLIEYHVIITMKKYYYFRIILVFTLYISN